jgi:hypothetical protein
VYTFAFYIELHTEIFSFNMPTFPSERHGSTLALITLVQLAIMLLAIKIRGSATWAIVFVVLISFLLALLHWRQSPREERTWRRLLGTVPRWPLVILVGGFFVYNEYVKTTLHQVYFTDDVIPYHGLWASAFAGVLIFAPELMPKDSKTVEIGRRVGIDAAVHVAALEYLNDTHFLPLSPDYPRNFSVHPSFLSPWTGTYKTKLMDDIMRRIVIRIAAHGLAGKLLHS